MGKYGLCMENCNKFKISFFSFSIFSWVFHFPSATTGSLPDCLPQLSDWRAVVLCFGVYVVWTLRLLCRFSFDFNEKIKRQEIFIKIKIILRRRRNKYRTCECDFFFQFLFSFSHWFFLFSFSLHGFNFFPPFRFFLSLHFFAWMKMDNKKRRNFLMWLWICVFCVIRSTTIFP